MRFEQWRTLWVPLAVTGFVVALASPAVAVPGDLDASAPIATTSHLTSRCSRRAVTHGKLGEAGLRLRRGCRALSRELMEPRRI